MKKILFDFLPFQDEMINGGTLFTRKILIELSKYDDIEIIGVCLDKTKINNKLFGIDKIGEFQIIEIKELKNFVEENKIQSFFIGISARYNSINLCDIPCNIYIFCHDLTDFSMSRAGIYEDMDFDRYKFHLKLNQVKCIKLKVLKKIAKNLIKNKSMYLCRTKKIKLIKKLKFSNFDKLIKRKNVFVLTVSEYSKNSLNYYFDGIYNEIQVFWPPEEIFEEKPTQVNLDSLNGKPYFLLLSVNRYNKNLFIFYNVFEKWNKMHDNAFSCVLVGIDSIDLPNSKCLKYVSDDELIFLLKNCYALVYPSLAEGFGSPPVECMKYEKPVIAGFDTSIPEVCGDDALLFNPLYEEDLFYKQNLLFENYNKYSELAKNRYKEISKKQKEDLEKLINLIKN